MRGPFRVLDNRSVEFRTAASILAVAMGTFICLSQQHFTLSVSAPSSFVTMTHHRCGLVLLASLAWFLVEIANLLRHVHSQAIVRVSHRD